MASDAIVNFGFDMDELEAVRAAAEACNPIELAIATAVAEACAKEMTGRAVGREVGEAVKAYRAKVAGADDAEPVE